MLWIKTKYQQASCSCLWWICPVPKKNVSFPGSSKKTARWYTPRWGKASASFGGPSTWHNQCLNSTKPTSPATAPHTDHLDVSIKVTASQKEKSGGCDSYQTENRPKSHQQSQRPLNLILRLLFFSFWSDKNKLVRISQGEIPHLLCIE